jgi:TnpA family transposase
MMLLENGTALRLANDGCVAFMRRHPITRSWGEGTLASCDSMSLDATRHLFSARIDPRRQRRGIGIYTHKLDQWPLTLTLTETDPSMLIKIDPPAFLLTRNDPIDNHS